MEPLIRLAEIVEQDIINEKIYLEKIANAKIAKLFIPNFWSISYHRCLHYFANEKKISDSKQSFYLCGRVDEYLIKKYDSKILHAGIARISIALLSDCTPLIERYALLKDSRFEYHINRGTIVYAIQCAIREDKEGLKNQIDLLSKTAETKRGNWVKPDVAFFTALLNSDMAGMEAALAELVTPKRHKQRNDFPIRKDLISIPALTYAKLAWLKGFEVQVDSPLVPKELLPHRPNKEYIDSYEFLKELDGEIKPDKPEVKMMEGLSYKDYKPKPTKIITYENTLLAFKEAARDNINLTEDEFKKLADMAWLAYTDPKAFDKKHIAYLREVGWGSHTFIDDVKYLYEHPLQHLWTLFKTDQDYYIEVIAQFISAHFFNDSDYDFMLETTIGKLLTEVL